MKHVLFLFGGLLFLIQFGMAFLEGLVPQPMMDIAIVFWGTCLFVLGTVIYYRYKHHHAQIPSARWPCALLLFLMIGSNVASYGGYLFRPIFFSWARPELNKIARLFQEDKFITEREGSIIRLPAYLPYFPKTAHVITEQGHRQLNLIMGGHYMTACYAFVWCEDGKPPKSVLRYRIDDHDSVKPRGGGWYEAFVSNGH